MFLRFSPTKKNSVTLQAARVEVPAYVLILKTLKS